MPIKTQPEPRSLQEWMERHGVNAKQLRQMVIDQTGHTISEAMLSFILRGSKRCSRLNAITLNHVTKVPLDVLQAWPRVSESDKDAGKRQKTVA